MLLVISQSGETADTLGALARGQTPRARALAIINVVGSTIARESDGGIYMHAGPEIGVASTKAFISTLTILPCWRCIWAACACSRPLAPWRSCARWKPCPRRSKPSSPRTDAIKKLALKYAQADDFFFLGRGYTYPIALEGALKLKEISYIHAEGYSAAEMKHGPIALIDPKTPTVFFLPQDSMYEKTMANLAMIRARKGPIIALATEGDTQIQRSGRRCVLSAQTLEPIYPDPGRRAAATAGLPHRRRPRLRRGQAPQPGQKRDGGVAGFRRRDSKYFIFFQQFIYRGDYLSRLEAEFLLEFLERGGGAKGLHADDTACGADIAFPAEGRGLLDRDARRHLRRQHGVAIFLAAGARRCPRTASKPPATGCPSASNCSCASHRQTHFAARWR